VGPDCLRSKLTRHDSYWRPATAWIALLLLLCAVPTCIHVWEGLGLAQAALVTGVLIAAAAGVHLAARVFVRWKPALQGRR